MEGRLPSKKKLFISVIAVVVLIAGLTGGWLYWQSRPKKVATQATEQATKELNSAKCSDANLETFKEVQASLEKDADQSKYATAINNTGYCYLARKDFKNAAPTFTLLAETYKKAGNTEREEEVRAQVKNVEYLNTLSSENAKEVHTDEPLSN